MATFAPVQPHGPLEQLFDDVWYVNGSVVMAPTMRLGRNMIVARDGTDLTLISSVRLDDAAEKELTALGNVAHIVKIGTHGMDDAYYVDRFGAKMWALPDVQVADGLTVTDRLAVDADGSGSPIADMDVFSFELTKRPEAALLLKRHGGLLITCDSVQHWQQSPQNSFSARLACRFMGFMNPAQIGPPWRKIQTPEGGSLRPDFERLAALPFSHLIGGHGGFLRDEGPARLRDTIERVYGPA